MRNTVLNAPVSGLDPEDEKELLEANALMLAYQLSKDQYVNAPVVWDTMQRLQKEKKI